MSRISDGGSVGNGGQPKAIEAVKKVGEDLRDLGGQVREAAKEKYEQLTENARDRFDESRQAARVWEQDLESYIQEKPIQSVLFAAGAGLLLGLLWSR